MHITDLILKHATGLVICTKNKITVDSNPSFIAIYNKFREFSNWLMNKVAKGCYNGSKTKSKENGHDIQEIPLPNKTWVAGAQLMFQGLLRSKWAIDVYRNLPGVDDTFAKNILHKKNGSNWQNMRLSSHQSKNVPFPYELMIPSPICGHLWKYFLPNVKLKECVPPMQWSCP